MTKLEYEAKIRDLERQLIELKQAKADDKNDIPQPPHPRPYPEYVQTYFYIIDMGEVAETKWTSNRFDLGKHEIGNIFLTEEAAVFAAERLKVIVEMREWAGKWNDPYRILYINGRIELEPLSVGRCLSYGEIRFATEADAKNCIKAVGEDRLKKYYFGIPEDRGCCTSER